MILYFSLFFLVITSSTSTVIKVPTYTLNLKDELKQEVEIFDFQTLWIDHFKDFTNLIDGERVLGTLIRFIDDTEAMRFIGFLLSPQFKEIIWEIEVTKEFQEANAFLEQKGYDMQSVIEAINSDLNLPPFKPPPVQRYKNGVSGLLAAVIGSLPIEDMKTLFYNKLENNPEFSGLIEVVTSSEFTNIIKKMLGNAKFSEFKNIFESYGVDFEFVCEIFKEVFMDYDGIFCP